MFGFLQNIFGNGCCSCNKKEKSVVSDLFIDYFSYEYTYQCNNKDYNFVTF